MSLYSVCQFLRFVTLIPHLLHNWQVLNSDLRPIQIILLEAFVTFLVASRQIIWQFTTSKSDKTAVFHNLTDLSLTIILICGNRQSLHK